MVGRGVRVLLLVVVVALWAPALAVPASAVTQRVSVSSAGVQANADSEESVISVDGRYVAFYSSASNLVAGDTNGLTDIFVRDRSTGTTQRVNVSSTGVQANADSTTTAHGVEPDGGLAISADGRFVAFVSSASNLDG